MWNSFDTFTTGSYLYVLTVFWNFINWIFVTEMLCPGNQSKNHSKKEDFCYNNVKSLRINRLNLDDGYVLLRFYLCVEICNYRYIADPWKVFINSEICLCCGFIILWNSLFKYVLCRLQPPHDITANLFDSETNLHGKG